MERQLVHPKKPYQPDVVRPVVLGGTNAVTALDAVINLGGISETQVGQALGIAPLDVDNKIPIQFFPNLTGNTQPALLGPTQLFTNHTYDFEINNFDLLETYVISVDHGSVSHVKEIISVTTPSQPGPIVLTVNGKQYTFSILAPYLEVPHIIAPLANAVNVFPVISLRASPFTPTGIVDTHVNSSWQVATDAAFTNVVFETIEDTTVLGGCITSLDFTDDGEHIVIGSAWQSTLDTSVSNGSWDNSGASYLLSKNNELWELAHTYYSPLADATFGQAISISANGSCLAVGATGSGANLVSGQPSDNRGLVYIYE